MSMFWNGLPTLYSTNDDIHNDKRCVFLYPDIQKHLLISSEIVGRTSLSVIRCLFSVVWAECYSK